MMFKGSVMLDRIFAVFDTDGDGFINFNEFIRCLSILDSKASSLEKLRCTVLLALPNCARTT
jgi:Ca2+-binding EF-hand superfamily protein